MKFFEYFSLVEKKTQYTVLFKGEKLLAVSKVGLKHLMSDFTGNPLSGEYAHANIGYNKVDKLIKSYAEAKQKFYNNKKVKYEIGPSHKDYRSFLEALEIIDRHYVSYDVYIEAQVQGLSFANNGKGTFPTAGALATEKAEDRLLNYLRDNNPNKLVEEVITSEDLKLDLDQNQKFQNYVNKILEGIATLKEAKYAQKIFYIKKRRGNKKIDSYVRTLEDHVK